MTMSTKYIEAAKDGRTDILREALKKDLNAVSEDGFTATHWAAREGRLEALRLIVGRGGDVNKCDYLGYTALHHSAHCGKVDIVSYLINWGCNLFALDNDHHSAMDIALLYEKYEVARQLDGACAQQQSKNPKIVGKLKEEAMKNADRNIRRYQKLQEGAARKVENEQRRIALLNGDFKLPGKKSVFQTLTMKLRVSQSKRKQVPQYSSRTYSDLVYKAGGSRYVSNKKINPLYANRSTKDDDKKRTLNGIQGASPEVMYISSRGENSATEVVSTRPTALEVFNPKRSSLNKSYKSESDLLVDSGVDSCFDDHEDDDDNQPGLLYRPGFGQTAFFRRVAPAAVSTLQSFDSEVDGDFNSSRHREEDVIVDRMRDLPWDHEDVETLDDDEEDSEFSSLEMFLVSAGLQSYISHFTKEKIDLNLLLKMDDKELLAIGLKYGPRKKILDVIERRKKVMGEPSGMDDSFL